MYNIQSVPLKYVTIQQFFDVPYKNQIIESRLTRYPTENYPSEFYCT